MLTRSTVPIWVMSVVKIVSCASLVHWVWRRGVIELWVRVATFFPGGWYRAYWVAVSKFASWMRAFSVSWRCITVMGGVEGALVVRMCCREESRLLSVL